MFVMDEADKLLSPEFVPLIDRLLSYTPPTRQCLCFSATFPITVKDFAQKWSDHDDTQSLFAFRCTSSVLRQNVAVSESII